MGQGDLEFDFQWFHWVQNIKFIEWDILFMCTSFQRIPKVNSVEIDMFVSCWNWCETLLRVCGHIICVHGGPVLRPYVCKRGSMIAEYMFGIPPHFQDLFSHLQRLRGLCSVFADGGLHLRSLLNACTMFNRKTHISFILEFQKLGWPIFEGNFAAETFTKTLNFHCSL